VEENSTICLSGPTVFAILERVWRDEMKTLSSNPAIKLVEMPPRSEVRLREDIVRRNSEFMRKYIPVPGTGSDPTYDPVRRLLAIPQVAEYLDQLQIASSLSHASLDEYIPSKTASQLTRIVYFNRYSYDGMLTTTSLDPGDCSGANDEACELVLSRILNPNPPEDTVMSGNSNEAIDTIMIISNGENEKTMTFAELMLVMARYLADHRGVSFFSTEKSKKDLENEPAGQGLNITRLGEYLDREKKAMGF